MMHTAATPAQPGTNTIFTRIGVFAVLWVVVFILYYPAAQAGWVTDTLDWQQKVRDMSFRDYLNLTQTRVPSLYQFTQLITWLLYQVLGSGHRAWHLLNISLQSANATLLFVLFSTLGADSGVKNSKLASFCGVLFFCICPHISEVLVWKASFHYLLSLLLILLILRCVQLFMANPRGRYALVAGILFVLSAFSLEVFYLTPWLALTLIIFYVSLPGYKRDVAPKAVMWFVLPMLLVFAGHLMLLRLTTGYYAAHLGDNLAQPVVNYLRKAPAYLFHILFFGRFWTNEHRTHIYELCASVKWLWVFYIILLGVLVFIVLRFRHMGGRGKVMAILFTWTVMSMALVSPVWLPYEGLVAYDRYAYIMTPFIYLLLVFTVSAVPWKPVWLVAVAAYVLPNLHYTRKVNKVWQQSNEVLNTLLSSFPDPGSRTVLLLNQPENMYGIPMLGSFPQSMFRLQYNLNSPGKISGPVFGVAGYNLLTPADGAHVRVVNDTTLTVTLNQWGTWWWYNGLGAGSYQNECFRVDMKDQGHRYDLILRQPDTALLILYETRGLWKTVNMTVRDKDQD